MVQAFTLGLYWGFYWGFYCSIGGSIALLGVLLFYWGFYCSIGGFGGYIVFFFGGLYWVLYWDYIESAAGRALGQLYRDYIGII